MSKKVLIVDDESEVVSFLGALFDRMEIDNVKALSGEEAMAIFKSQPIDFVFLDIKLKSMDGLTVLEEFKKISPAVPVVMITGRNDVEYKLRAKTLGALDYITKPLDMKELKVKINKYILQ